MSNGANPDERLQEAVELSLALMLNGLLVGGFVGFIVIMPAIFSGGHGDFENLANIAFPLGSLSDRYFEQSPIVLVSLAQFPIYGLIIGIAHYKGWAWRAVIFLSILHAAASYLCFAIPR